MINLAGHPAAREACQVFRITCSRIGKEPPMRRKMHLLIIPALILAIAAPVGAAPSQSGRPRNVVRFATFNASLNRNNAGQLVADLSRPTTRRPGSSPRSSSAPGPTCC
jgi:hypothetical protein